MSDNSVSDSLRSHDENAPGRFGVPGLLVRGFCMGAADVVPGVSGGTMAFILGIYEELIESIRAFARPPFWKAIFSFDVRAALVAVNARFLIALGSGILIAVVSLAKGITWMLEHQPVLIWSFFFGLILGSIVVVRKRVTSWIPMTFALLAAGAVGAFAVVGLVPVETTSALWFYFLSGALAICAMILPGISGSFILVLLGKYHAILTAVNDRDLVILGTVASGCAIGLVAFSQVLGWLFKRYHDPTVAVLIGFMLGSLRKVWPWKVTLETFTDRHGNVKPLVQSNALPEVIFSGEVATAVIALLIGFVAVYLIEAKANRN